MIITKTPFRMSFFGGGTDLPEFFNEFGGAVLSTTFDKYCYINARHLPPFFEYTSELVYSKIERITNIEDFNHPLVREAMRMLDMHELRINYEADLPARTGLGTSSSFAVGLLNAFYALKGKYADKRKLALDAIKLERELCAEAGGWQDQIAASFGGFNRISFSAEGFEVEKVIISEQRKKQLNDNLLLFFTGFTHMSAEIHESSKKMSDEKVKRLKRILELVDDAERILTDENRDIDDFGRLLDITWKLKQKTGTNISTSAIDELYECGIKAGALGGKLLGAGGGGFLLFYVQPEKRDAVLKALNKLLLVPFKFENAGTRVVYYTPEFYDPDLRREL